MKHLLPTTPLLALALLLTPVGSRAHDGDTHGAPALAASAQAGPRIEAHSELFELVGTLGGGELSLLIDRYASNEPVLKAEVEVESGGIKAKAKFHPDHGDFSVDDPALLKRLAAPGEHALVITILAGADSDLLDGVLHVSAPGAAEAGHAHDHGASSPHWLWAFVPVAGLLALAGAWRIRLRRRKNSLGDLA